VEWEHALSYRKDLAIAARRHLKAAQTLYEANAAGAQPGCRCVAGYLFGLAGELAVKEMMRTCGMRELPQDERLNDPFYAHFPKLKTLLTNAVQGRRANELRQLAENSQLFQYWDTQMRYAPTDDIMDKWVAAWKANAEQLVDKMEFL
jgi:hypothetical protein